LLGLPLLAHAWLLHFAPPALHIETWEWDLTYDEAAGFAPEPSYIQNATVAYTFDRAGTHTFRLRNTDVPNDGVPREAVVEATIDAAGAHPGGESSTTRASGGIRSRR